MTEAPKEIKELVKRFEDNLKAYKSGAYKEDQLRQEFINPFFEALGWDMENRAGAAPQYRDVIHEDSIKVAKGTKAPDYAFTLAGRKMFFVEAKKPSVDIKKDTHPAYQLRRYAWSAGLPLSILTDFEEFAVYESRKRPDKNDKASTERIMYLTYKDYIERWDEIYSIFSKDAVLKGSFDRFAEEAKNKRGTAKVDEEFLKEIEQWRTELARNIALRNSDLTVRELNYAVQRTIDRIIFLRMCEDMGAEKYGQLLNAAEKEDIYASLVKLYRKADEKYNSGLFHFKKEKGRGTHPDDITPKLTIDDKVLKRIIKGLYYPDSPYEFSVLSPEILGNVYEQFLGKVIRLTKGHRAKVEEKPEVKKAGGVYYTPQYIVEYIVENTVGKLCKGKTPKQLEELRILDPACGSGSFLLGAYTYLLKYHLDHYTKAKNPKKYKDKVYQDKNGEWRLTIREKKRILLNNIYGVDIDEQAVEVTKLSLLLKVLEGENRDVLEAQKKLWQERALPDLGNNIKCGNSLIGPDFYTSSGGVQTTLFDDDEMDRINVFDWNTEFKDIMERGGFDAVIGNPPYVRQETLGPEFKGYAKNKFSTFAGTADLYVYFIEQGHRLLKKEGMFGMITSNKFMRANYGKGLRNFLSEKTKLVQIVDFGELPVFKKAATFPAIIITANKQVKKQKFIYAPIKRLNFKSLKNEVKNIGTKLDNRAVSGYNWTLAPAEEIEIIEKMKKNGKPLREYVDGKIYRGVLTGLNEAFVIDEETKDRLIKEDKSSAELIKPFVVGDDVRKYHINFRGRYLILIPSGWTRKNMQGKDAWEWFSSTYPAVARHLAQFEAKAKKRWDKGEYWWELRPCDYYDKFEKTKISWPEIAMESRFTFDGDGYYLNKTCFFSPVEDFYLLGILNSKLQWFFLKLLCSVLGDANKRGRLLQQKIYVEQLPIPTLDLSNPSEKKMHDDMVKLVEKNLDLHKRLADAKTPNEKERIQRQIDAIDRAIDSLVYELYGLTDEEIRIVEGRE